jgi:hypothetical protein
MIVTTFLECLKPNFNHVSVHMCTEQLCTAITVHVKQACRVCFAFDACHIVTTTPLCLDSRVRFSSLTSIMKMSGPLSRSRRTKESIASQQQLAHEAAALVAAAHGRKRTSTEKPSVAPLLTVRLQHAIASRLLLQSQPRSRKVQKHGKHEPVSKPPTQPRMFENLDYCEQLRSLTHANGTFEALTC